MSNAFDGDKNDGDCKEQLLHQCLILPEQTA